MLTILAKCKDQPVWHVLGRDPGLMSTSLAPEPTSLCQDSRSVVNKPGYWNSKISTYKAEDYNLCHECREKFEAEPFQVHSRLFQ